LNFLIPLKDSSLGLNIEIEPGYPRHIDTIRRNMNRDTYLIKERMYRVKRIDSGRILNELDAVMQEICSYNPVRIG